MSRNKAAIALAFLFLPALALPVRAQLAVADQTRIDTWKYEWKKTDFTKFSIDYADIISGGPPRDGIPPIDRPTFITPAQAAKWVTPEEPVLVVRHGGAARAYPLQVLIWHEIVNDRVGGLPVLVTFCPLCNSALVFDRRLDGRELDFGTTGKLRNSDLVMWDRQTESWWQQLTGEGIVGEYTGKKLTFLPAPLISFTTFRENFPEGTVLSRETGHSRDYGSNPYAGYDSPGNRPFLFKGPVDPRLPAMDRVLAVEFGTAVMAYPFPELRKARVVNQTLGGEDFAIFFRDGTRSALDGRDIGSSRDVGSATVFSRRMDGKLLTFEQTGNTFRDRETGSTWNFLGTAIAGKFKGKSLKPLVHGQHFAFAWLAFRPNSGIWHSK